MSLITDHPYRAPEPRSLEQRARGELVWRNCANCDASPDNHLFVPDSERTWALAPYANTGLATYPVPAGPLPRSEGVERG